MPRFGDKRYVPIPGWRSMDTSRRLADDVFRPIQEGQYQKRKYLYQVQVVTRDNRTDDLIYRTINVGESRKSALDDVLQSAADTIMESPIAARETLERVELVDARRK